MDDAWLTCPPELEWQILFDYPFDDQGHGPDEDARRIDRFRDARRPDAAPNPTVVWLPTFFSHTLERELGELVALDHILDVDQKTYLGHLRVEDQSTTRADLASLRAQKRALLQRTLGVAYGLTQSSDSQYLDQSRDVEEHLIPLLDDLEVRRIAATMRDGFEQVVETILHKRYPHHPRFDGGQLTAGRMEKVYALVYRLLDQPERRMSIDRAEQKELRGWADPLGITETSESATVLREPPFRDLEQRRQQVGLDTPTVGQVRSWLDPQATRGLPREVEDVLIALYTTWSGRTFQRDANAYFLPRPGQLPDDVELLRPELPTQQEWVTALERVGSLFGVAVSGKSLGARNLAAFVTRVKEKVKGSGSAAALVTGLEARTRDWTDPARSHRLITAKAAATLIAELSSADGAELVRVLAGFTPATSLAAMGRSLTTANEALAALNQEPLWLLFQQVANLREDAQRGQRATALLAELAALLETDELNKMLTEGLTDLTRKASDVLRVAAPPPAPPRGEQVVFDERRELTSPAAAAEHLRAVADRVEADAREGSEQRFLVQVTAWKKEPTR